MAETPAIRPAGARDARRVLSLWLDLIEHHRSLDPGYPPLPGVRGLLLREIERGLRARHCRLLVADAGDGAVGFLFAEVPISGGAAALADRSGRIHEVYVEPAWRRSGVGSALLGFADQWFKERSVFRVSVRVEPGNRGGMRFWKRSGFQSRAHILERV